MLESHRSQERYWLGLSAAMIIVAFLFVLPNLLMIQYRSFYQRHFPEAAKQWVLDGRYSTLQAYADYTEASLYAGRVKEASEHWIPGDPFHKENNSRALQMTDTLSFMFLGQCVRLTGHMETGWLLGRGLCGMLWVASLYLLVFHLTRRLEAALFISLALPLFFDLLMPFHPNPLRGPQGAALHVFWWIGTYGYNLGASRLINPALNYPAFLFAAYLAIRTAEERHWRWPILGGIAGGALAYIHVDVFTMYFGTMLLFILYTGWKDRRWPGTLTLSFGLTCLLSLPWILTHVPPAPDLLARSNIQYGRLFDFNGFFFLAIALFFLRMAREKHVYAFAASSALAAAGFMETQCITGYSLQSDHWFWLGFALALIFLLALIADRVSYRWAIAPLIVLAACRGAAYASHRFPYQGLRSCDETAFHYLETHTAPESVVAVLDPIEMAQIPIFTHNKVVLGNGFPIVSDLSTVEIIQRLRFELALFGIPSSEFTRRLDSLDIDTLLISLDHARWVGKTDWVAEGWSMFIKTTAHCLPIATFISELKRLEVSPPPAYEASFVWVSDFEKSLLKQIPRSWGAPVYQNEKVAIYKLAEK